MHCRLSKMSSKCIWLLNYYSHYYINQCDTLCRPFAKEARLSLPFISSQASVQGHAKQPFPTWAMIVIFTHEIASSCASTLTHKTFFYSLPQCLFSRDPPDFSYSVLALSLEVSSVCNVSSLIFFVSVLFFSRCLFFVRPVSSFSSISLDFSFCWWDYVIFAR